MFPVLIALDLDAKILAMTLAVLLVLSSPNSLYAKTDTNPTQQVMRTARSPTRAWFGPMSPILKLSQYLWRKVVIGTVPIPNCLRNL